VLLFESTCGGGGDKGVMLTLVTLTSFRDAPWAALAARMALRCAALC
jgi:hypothetical protein